MYRRRDLDDVLQVRRELRQRVDDGISEGISLFVSCGEGLECIVGVLHEDRHYVLAGRRHGWVVGRWD